jgi:hypothetical protein
MSSGHTSLIKLKIATPKCLQFLGLNAAAAVFIQRLIQTNKQMVFIKKERHHADSTQQAPTASSKTTKQKQPRQLTY